MNERRSVWYRAFLKGTPVILIPSIGYFSTSILFHAKWFLGTQALLITDTISYHLLYESTWLNNLHGLAQRLLGFFKLLPLVLLVLVDSLEEAQLLLTDGRW